VIALRLVSGVVHVDNWGVCNGRNYKLRVESVVVVLRSSPLVAFYSPVGWPPSTPMASSVGQGYIMCRSLCWVGRVRLRGIRSLYHTLVLSLLLMTPYGMSHTPWCAGHQGGDGSVTVQQSGWECLSFSIYYALASNRQRLPALMTTTCYVVAEGESERARSQLSDSVSRGSPSRLKKEFWRVSVS
jgi:hypothetical protein